MILVVVDFLHLHIHKLFFSEREEKRKEKGNKESETILWGRGTRTNPRVGAEDFLVSRKDGTTHYSAWAHAHWSRDSIEGAWDSMADASD